MDEKISVVIPTYNEIDNIQKLIPNIQRVLEEITPKYEILVVDDNSPDGTGKFVENLSKKDEKIRVIIREEKIGLGDAYKFGFQNVNGDIIFEMDADLSHNPKDIPKFLKALKHSDIVVGSRYIKGGSNLYRQKTRIIISKVANFLASFFFRLNRLTDSTSGFRAYKRKVIDTIIPHISCQKYTFQVEILEKAQQFKFSIREVPIKFQDRYDGESKFNLSEILAFLKEIVKKSFSILKFRKTK